VKVIQHERKRLASHFSIERLFGEIRAHMPQGFDVVASACPSASRGLWPRIGNVRHAARLRADVHHIVGDVHYLAFGLPRARTVLTIHDCAALNRLKGWKRGVLRYFWFSGPMSRAAVITAISASGKDELRRWVGAMADRVEIVPDCVPGGFFHVPKMFREQAPVCLQVGTKWNKNAERVAQALSGTGCRLEIVGSLNGEQRETIAATGVAFRELGTLPDEGLGEAYRRCDFVAFASLYEGFGLPVLEAQATGRPVITSSFGPMSEVAGGAALLVDPFSVQSIRAAVQTLLRDAALRADLVVRGLQNVERFRPCAVAARYAAIYERVAMAADGR
jgi:glycosyltransferase involved in cell wall biosynthesis